MSQVKFCHVDKSYASDLFAVKDFNLTINDGEFVSLLGPSGCGKTTALRMLAGLERNTNGSIEVDNQIVSDPQKKLFIPPEKRKIGMVFQSYAVWPHMNVFDNVAYPLKMAKVSKDSIKEKVIEILQLVEMGSLEKRMPHQLSGGQQQRVALARGLVMRPRVLLMDEPLCNLDAKLREKMRKDIRQIQQKLKLTVLYVTHDQIEAVSMSDKMAIMNQGEILQIGTPQEVCQTPANEFVADFVKNQQL